MYKISNSELMCRERRDKKLLFLVRAKILKLIHIDPFLYLSLLELFYYSLKSITTRIGNVYSDDL